MCVCVRFFFYNFIISNLRFYEWFYRKMKNVNRNFVEQFAFWLNLHPQNKRSAKIFYCTLTWWMCEGIKFGVGDRVHFSPFSQLAVISKPSTYLHVHVLHINVCTYHIDLNTIRLPATLIQWNRISNCTFHVHWILPEASFQRWNRDIVENFQCVHNHSILLDHLNRCYWHTFPNRSFWYGHLIYPNQHVYLWFHPLRSALNDVEKN